MKKIMVWVGVVLILVAGFIVYDNFKTKAEHAKLLFEYNTAVEKHAQDKKEWEKEEGASLKIIADNVVKREVLKRRIETINIEKNKIVKAHKEKIAKLETKLPHELVTQWNDAIGGEYVNYRPSGNFCTTIIGARFTLAIFVKKDELNGLYNEEHLKYTASQATIKSYKVDEIEWNKLIVNKNKEIKGLKNINVQCDNIVKDIMKDTKRAYYKGLTQGGCVVLAVVGIVLLIGG